jgi:ribosomal protein S16
MLKLRLKRTGRKRSPSYRLVIMENTFRRDGDLLKKLDIIIQLQNNINLMEKKLKNG